MNTLNYRRFRSDLRKAIDVSSWQNPYAVTLSLKQAISNNGGYSKIDAIKASENVRHFRKRLNRSLLGRGWERKRLSLACFAVCEGTASVRLHVHLCLDRPDSVTFEQFAAQIAKNWTATTWGYNEIDIKPCSDLNGWLDYMTKRRSKSDFASSIDWINTTGCVA